MMSSSELLSLEDDGFVGLTVGGAYRGSQAYLSCGADYNTHMHTCTLTYISAQNNLFLVATLLNKNS